MTGGGVPGPSTPADWALVDPHIRQAKALELRAQGYEYSEIALELGYAAESGAWHAVNAALERAVQEPAATVRSLEARRLNQMLKPFLRAAAGGDKDAADRVLRIMARRAALLGLDAPAKVAPTNPEGDAPYDRSIDPTEAAGIVAALAALAAGPAAAPAAPAADEPAAPDREAGDSSGE